MIAALCPSLTTGCAHPDVTATLADDGGHVDIDSGDVLDIVLPDNYTTRQNRWHAEDETYDMTVLAPLGSKYDPDATTPGQSAPGMYTGRYQGNKPGTVHLTLVAEDDHPRPVTIFKRFSVDVTVH